MFVFTSGMNSSFWPILVTNLLMTSCFSFGFNYVTSYEQQAVRLNWDNIFESPIEGDQFNFAYTCVMLLFDAAIYSVIAIVVILVQNRKKASKSHRWASISPNNSSG